MLAKSGEKSYSLYAEYQGLKTKSSQTLMLLTACEVM